MLEKLYKEIPKNDITIIASRPLNGKVEVMIHFLFELGIKQKKKIWMFHLDDPSNFYVQKLISWITKIEEKEIRYYFHPCSCDKKKLKIKSSFISALEQVGNSNIKMVDLGCAILSEDILDYILNYEEIYQADYIIINTFDSMVKKSNYKGEELLEKLKQYTQNHPTKIVLLANVNKKGETRVSLKDICYYHDFKKYASKILLTYQTKSKNENLISVLTFKDGKVEMIDSRKGSEKNE